MPAKLPITHTRDATLSQLPRGKVAYISAYCLSVDPDGGLYLDVREKFSLAREESRYANRTMQVQHLPRGGWKVWLAPNQQLSPSPRSGWDWLVQNGTFDHLEPVEEVDG